MGIADAIPGVSGGTIALITGIYEELINSFKSLNRQALTFLAKGKFEDFWSHINGNFLVVLLSGIAISIISLAEVLTFILANYPIPIWSFFFGLIMISSVSVIKEINKWNFVTAISVILGIAVAYYLTLISPTETPSAWWIR